MKGIPPKNYFTHTSKRQISRGLRGFTIVELLIVVVVIAILAAITIVAYNGITANARDSALKADLNTAAKKVGIAQAETGAYPSMKPAGLSDIIQYSQTSGGQGFCATAAKDGRAFHITQSGSIQEGACSGHTTGGGGNEIAANSPIQNVTSAQCQALPEFTGSNTSAIRTVTDNRGGTTRTYEIAKLADGKCWMLTNLKLGSTSGAITLTPADTSVASNFTLPQLTTGGAGEYDTPRAYGPVPGDTGAGSSNYGYLYNFSAATAGETRATLATGSAQHSICPVGWRLPTGGKGEVQTDLIELDIAFGGAGPYVDNSELDVFHWRYGGAFKGTYSGVFDPEFSNLDGQGEFGILWSASVNPDWADDVFGVDFSDISSAPHSGGIRSVGAAIRCLLN